MPTNNCSPTCPPPAPPPKTGSGRWGYLLVNLGALPGLGSLAAGYRVGWAQLVLSTTGFVLTLWWATGFFVEWWRTGQMPVRFDHRFLAGVIGAVLFLIAWVWSLRTGLAILRGSHESRPPPRSTS